MLRGIDPLLTPELLMILRAMGHGDEIAIVDANFSAVSNALRSLSLMPLDSFVKDPAACMQVVGKPKEIGPDGEVVR